MSLNVFFVYFFFSKISFLHGAIFLLYWELAFFGLSIFFFPEILYISHTNTQTNTYTYTHIYTDTYVLHCGNLTVCITTIVMFVFLLL